MGRSQETYNKKEVRNKREKKRKEKEKKRLARKENEKASGLDDMIAYVDEHGRISSTPPDPEKKEEIKAEDIQLGVPAREADDNTDTTRIGTVDFFNESKGFGFIKDRDTRQGIFFHVNDVEGEVREGNLVTYEPGMGQKGAVAKNVKKYIPQADGPQQD